MGMRMLLVMVCLASLLQAADTAPKSNIKEAKAAYKLAEKLAKAGDWKGAFEAYKEASEKLPESYYYIIHREIARQNLAAQMMKEGQYAAAYAIDPTNDNARLQAERAIHPVTPESAPGPPSRSTPASEETTPPLEFEPKPVKVAWNLRGDTKALYLAVGAAYGIHFDFEDEVQPVTTRLVMEEVDFAQAVTALGIITRTFTAPIAPRSGLVIQDITVKRVQYEHMTLRVLDATELQTPEAINEAANLLRTLFEMRFVIVNIARKEILVRDELSKVDQADRIIRSLSHGLAQVLIEFQILEISSVTSRQLGFLPTTTYSLSPVNTSFNFSGGRLSTTTGAATGTPAGTATFGGGNSLMAVTMPSASLLAAFSDSRTRSSTVITERATDGQVATFTDGIRYPIVTAIVSYNTGASSTTTSSGVPANSTPSFQYVDLGIKLKVTPYVHGDGDITLKIEATSTALGADNYNGDPVIENREMSTQMRLHDGEPVILAGMLTSNDAKSLAGIPGIGQVPGLQFLLGQRSDSRNNDDFLMIVTPHIMRMGPNQTGNPRAIASPDHTVPVKYTPRP
jgi:general secretion pathway protein D